MFEIFNTDLLRASADAHAEQLSATMRASRVGSIGLRARQWAGRGLVRAGEALSGERPRSSARPRQGHPAAR
jgi:hypothetical protein